jgi:hypothetical protein
MPADFMTVWSDLAANVAAKAGSFWLFRGHGDASWVLRPNIGRPYRRTPGGRRLFFDEFDERAMLQEFAREAELHFDDGLSTDFELLALAQHYGLPTRLLDWTQNLYVAAYFACQNEALDGVDAAIVAIGVTAGMIRSDLDDLSRTMFTLPASTPPLFVRVPSIDFRIQQQHGVFTLHPDPWDEWKPAPPDVVVDPVFVIPAHLKPEFRRALKGVDFHAGRLMRDFDQICERIRGKYL